MGSGISITIVSARFGEADDGPKSGKRGAVTRGPTLADHIPMLRVTGPTSVMPTSRSERGLHFPDRRILGPILRSV